VSQYGQQEPHREMDDGLLIAVEFDITVGDQCAVQNEEETCPKHNKTHQAGVRQNL
jgi:hypothetical protein